MWNGSLLYGQLKNIILCEEKVQKCTALNLKKMHNKNIAGDESFWLPMLVYVVFLSKCCKLNKLNRMLCNAMSALHCSIKILAYGFDNHITATVNII